MMTSSALRDAVLLNENIIGHIMSFVPLQAVLSLKEVSRDQLVVVLCSKPELYSRLMKNKEKVLRHREWFEFVRKQLQSYEMQRTSSLQRHLQKSNYLPAQDDRRESKLRVLQRKWWVEHHGWATERDTLDAERDLVRSVIESYARLGALCSLV